MIDFSDNSCNWCTELSTVCKLRKFTLTDFGKKKFMKVTFLLKKLLKNWFHEIIFYFFRKSKKELLFYYTVYAFGREQWKWKLRKFTLSHFLQKFRESNGFTIKEITKQQLIWRNIFFVRDDEGEIFHLQKFSLIHTLLSFAKISWKQCFY